MPQDRRDAASYSLASQPRKAVSNLPLSIRAEIGPETVAKTGSDLFFNTTPASTCLSKDHACRTSPQRSVSARYTVGNATVLSSKYASRSPLRDASGVFSRRILGCYAPRPSRPCKRSLLTHQASHISHIGNHSTGRKKNQRTKQSETLAQNMWAVVFIV